MTSSTAAFTSLNFRTINIDALDADSSANFDLASLTPGVQPVSGAELQSRVGRVRGLLRGGDSEGALREALMSAVYGDVQGKDAYSSAVVEILQSIRQAEMTPLLTRIYESDGGVELLDVLMKYLYKGMNQSTSSAANAAATKNVTPQATGYSQIQSRGGGDGGGQQMSVLLSWHEKVVELAGPGSIVRVMTDRRTV